jgi:hypothetical protein
MSDELKKQPRRWIWWTALVLFVLYPLSIGPACWITKRIVEPGPFLLAYAPIIALCCLFEPMGCLFDRYLSFWR